MDVEGRCARTNLDTDDQWNVVGGCRVRAVTAASRGWSHLIWTSPAADKRQELTVVAARNLRIWGLQRIRKHWVETIPAAGNG